MTTETALQNYKEAGLELRKSIDRFTIAFDTFKKRVGFDGESCLLPLNDFYRPEMLELGDAIKKYRETESYWFELMEEADRMTTQKLSDPEFWKTASPGMKELKKAVALLDAKSKDIRAHLKEATDFHARDDLRLELCAAESEKQRIEALMHETLQSESN